MDSEPEINVATPRAGVNDTAAVIVATKNSNGILKKNETKTRLETSRLDGEYREATLN